MLARSFLTATDLGITDIEHGALIEVLGMLERHEIEDLPVHARLCGSLDDEYALTKFSMALTTVRTDCGSAGCMMGWARAVAKQRLFDRVARDEGSPLWELFFGPLGMSAIADEAAIALSNYLTTGQPRWTEAVA